MASTCFCSLGVISLLAARATKLSTCSRNFGLLSTVSWEFINNVSTDATCPITVQSSNTYKDRKTAKWIARPDRAVTSFTVPGGHEFHFPHFSSNFDKFFLRFVTIFSFSSSFWPSKSHPGRPWLRHWDHRLCYQGTLSHRSQFLQNNPHMFDLNVLRGKIGYFGTNYSSFSPWIIET